jgi:invasion protein IalB
MRRLRSASTAIAAALALAGAAPGLAAEPSTTPPQAAATPADATSAKEKLVCTTETVTGSLRPKRVCLTQQQIKAQREAVDDLVRERRELGGGSAGETNRASLSASGTLTGR